MRCRRQSSKKPIDDASRRSKSQMPPGSHKPGLYYVLHYNFLLQHYGSIAPAKPCIPASQIFGTASRTDGPDTASACMVDIYI